MPRPLLAVKDNQPTLHSDIKSYFETAPSGAVGQVRRHADIIFNIGRAMEKQVAL